MILSSLHPLSPSLQLFFPSTLPFARNLICGGHFDHDRCYKSLAFRYLWGWPQERFRLDDCVAPGIVFFVFYSVI